MARSVSAFSFLVLVLLSPLHAQFDQLVSPMQTPQARSQQEFDDYLKILDIKSAQDKAEQIEAFCKSYPESELLGVVYQLAMAAYREMGNLDRMVENGRKALQRLPDNLNTLTALADAIPNRVSGNGEEDRRRLDEAERYAEGIFAGIQRIRLPHSVLPEEWRVMRLEMEASAHESLGHIASKRGRWKQAVGEFEKATQQNPHPRGSQFYRLGVARLLVGSDQAAEEALHRAVELGPDEIRSLAKAVLQKKQKVQDR